MDYSKLTREDLLLEIERLQARLFEIDGVISQPIVFEKLAPYTDQPVEKARPETALDAGAQAQIEHVQALVKETQLKTAELSAVLENMTDGVYIGTIEGITIVNQAALDQLGFTSPEELKRQIGTLAEEINTRDYYTNEIIPAERQPFARSLGGERVVQEVRVRHRLTGEERVVRCAASPVVLDGQVIAAVAVNTDITTQKKSEESLQQSEERKTYLLKLSDALRPLTDPVEIQLTACRVLGEHTGVNRVIYGEVLDEKEIVTSRNFVKGVAPVVGRFKVADFGYKTIAAYKRNEKVIFSNIATDTNFSDEERRNFVAIEVAANASLGLVKDGRWVAAFGMHSATPRQWTLLEIGLLEETAERIWATLQQARAEKALRKVRKICGESLTLSPTCSGTANLMGPLSGLMIAGWNIPVKLSHRPPVGVGLRLSTRPTGKTRLTATGKPWGKANR